LVYAIAVLAILHFFWMRAGKRDFAEVFVYAGVIGVLLGWRLYRAFGPRYFMKLGSHNAKG
jgi:sulfoxide reductase heme-binding subunit YedZ